MLKGIFTVPAVIFAGIMLVHSAVTTRKIPVDLPHNQVYQLWVVWGYPNQYIIIIIPCLALAGLVGMPSSYPLLEYKHVLSQMQAQD